MGKRIALLGAACACTNLERRPFKEADYEQLLQWLLEDVGPAEGSGERAKILFPDVLAGSEASPTHRRLFSISNLTDVNTLVGKQVLSFGRSLTAVFGSNGSGKSGYARVLGRIDSAVIGCDPAISP